MLREKQLVDDSKTINSLVAQQTGKRAAGIEKMRSELLARNAPEELVEQRLARITPESQHENMLALLKSKCRPQHGRAKGARLLLSRGFEEDAIESALDEFFGSSDFSD